jgi:hypothetical protein
MKSLAHIFHGRRMKSRLNSLAHIFLFSEIIFLVLIGFTACGCKRVSKSLDVSRSAVEEFHRGAADGLCGRFSDEMIKAMPCDALARVIRQTRDAVGEPTGPCRWHYTWQIVKLNPFRTVTIYQCPYEKEDVKVTVVVDVTEEEAVVSGLWSDSPSIREQRVLIRVELCRDVDENALTCEAEISQAEWSWERIWVWTEWQGIRKGDKIIFEWYTPEGQAAGDFVHEVKRDPERSYKSWSWIEPEEMDIENPCGTWTVKIGVNGKEIEAFPVMVVADDH